MSQLFDLDQNDRDLIHDVVYGDDMTVLIKDAANNLVLVGTDIKNEFEFKVGVVYAYALMGITTELRDRHGRPFVEKRIEIITRVLNTYMDYFKSEIRRNQNRQKTLT